MLTFSYEKTLKSNKLGKDYKQIKLLSMDGGGGIPSIRQNNWFYKQNKGQGPGGALHSVDSTTFLIFNLQSTTKIWAKSTSTQISSNLQSTIYLFLNYFPILIQNWSLLGPWLPFWWCHRVLYYSETSKLPLWSFC